MSLRQSQIPAPNDVIGGKYRVESQVGEGGMAVVLAATHEGLRQRVAIKVIHPQYAGSPELKERFFREARALALIHSPHVARIFDVGTLDGGAAYLVLEYLEGLDLHRLLDRDGALSSSAAAAYVLQACEGLTEAHQLGILHRDLKPSNLFLVAGASGEPCVKLLDFGLAKLTEEGVSGLTEREDVMGSPSYMAPEQIRGLAQADARSDVWSLGVTLYELLTNALPFEGATPTKVAAAVLMEPPIPLLSRRRDVPPALSRAVMECLIKEPERRMASAKHLADCLRPFAASANLPAFAATTSMLAGVRERLPESNPGLGGKPSSGKPTMRIAPNEPTYGGMMPLVPPSSPTSGTNDPSHSELAALDLDGPTESDNPPAASEGERTLVDGFPAEPEAPIASEDKAPPPRVEKPDEATLVRLPKAPEVPRRPSDLRVAPEEDPFARLRRKKKIWIAVSATLAVSALVLFFLLNHQ